jgi:pyrophosphatase PpaX
LLDTKAMILASMRHATHTVLARKIPDAELMELVGQPLETQMQHFDPLHASELTAVYREHNQKIHDQQVAYFEGTREALDQLLALKTRIAVVTSKRNKQALHGLDCFNLAHYFEFLVGANDTNAHKPDPAPLLLAASRMGISVTNCIYVGDSPYDMQAARAANMTAVAALWGMFSRERLCAAGAQYEAATIAALPVLIRSILSGL